METDLNQTGTRQSRRLAKNLEDVNFDVCFCSPQKRARQTAEIIYTGDIIFDDRLAEIICGEFEGKDETPESFKQFFKASETGDKGVEKFSDFLERMCDFCEMLARDYKGKNILVITHAANARAANYYFSGRPKDYDFLKSVGKSGEFVTFGN